MDSYLFFAANEFCRSGFTFLMDGVRDWAQTESSGRRTALRIDDTQQFALYNVGIAFGSDTCGEYSTLSYVSPFGDSDLQYGYTGDNVHDVLTDFANGNIQNLAVRNLES